MISIEPFQREDAGHFDRPVEEVICEAEKSLCALTVRAGGRVIALWGWHKPTFLSGRLVLWALTNDDFLKHRIAVARASKKLWEMLPPHDEACGLVRCDFRRSVLWLQWLGFEVIETISCGGEWFHVFSRRA